MPAKKQSVLVIGAPLCLPFSSPRRLIPTSNTLGEAGSQRNLLLLLICEDEQRSAVNRLFASLLAGTLWNWSKNVVAEDIGGNPHIVFRLPCIGLTGSSRPFF